MRIPLQEILAPTQVVRAVPHDDIDMTLLTASIEEYGLLVPITVCQGKIVDGYRRFLCCKAIGWTEIETHQVEGDPDRLRIITQTRATEFTRDDKRALVGRHVVAHPEESATEIAHSFNWSPSEVESLCGVDYLCTPIRAAYKNGDLSLGEVWQLSRCRDETQLQLWSDGTVDLLDRAKAELREVRAARRRSMVTRPRGKSLGAITRERERLTEAGLALIKANAKTPLDGWRACLEWILSSK